MSELKLDKTEDEISWEKERKVTIELAKISDIEEIKEFCNANLYEDEPLTRSLGIFAGKSFAHKKVQKMLEEFTLEAPVKASATTPSCLIARSTETGKIIGTRLGEIKKNDPNVHMGDPSFRWLAYLPKFIPLPNLLVKTGNIQLVFDRLPYSHKAAFDELGSDFIYCAAHVCVGREARGQRLGTELVKRAHKLAEAAGCGHTYILATSIYSQKIFKNLGYKVLHEEMYDPLKTDQRGRPFLDNVGEHTSLQVVAYEHSVVKP